MAVDRPSRSSVRARGAGRLGLHRPAGRPPAQAEAATGLGLWLLDQYSTAHGVRRGPDGEVVRAVLCPAVRDPLEGSDAALAAWLDEVDGL